MGSEFFLAMLGANSQAESEATSSRVKWGVRAAFRDGKIRYQYKRWLRYRKGEDGKPEIVPEEAAIVRRIFDAYLAGHSLKAIKHMLEEEKISTKTGLTEWSVPSIQNILKNEKYTGDALLQKTYTTDPISKRQKINRGELPQYLVKNCHPAIISREAFSLAQKEMARRTAASSWKNAVNFRNQLTSFRVNWSAIMTVSPAVSWRRSRQRTQAACISPSRVALH